MILTFIGMSGTGKSYWASRLAQETGFRRFCVDDLIEAKLEPELVALGYKGINDVSKWMGQPYDERYLKTSQTYLNLEHKVMREILASINTVSPGTNIVIDTTGSVIYLPDDILNKLSECSVIVYLHTPESAHRAMAELYLSDPKPVIWGDAFRPLSEEETPEQTLTRCYPELLKDRAQKYQRRAQVTFDYDQLHAPTMTPQTIIDVARAHHA